MSETTPTSPRLLPNPEECHTRHIAVELSECLVKDPWTCPNAVRFGNGSFCHHPERRKFERKPTESN